MSNWYKLNVKNFTAIVALLALCVFTLQINASSTKYEKTVHRKNYDYSAKLLEGDE